VVVVAAVGTGMEDSDCNGVVGCQIGNSAR
jgi:hypothetical protein